VVAFQADKEKILKSATPWNVPSEHPDRLCGSDEAACARPGTLLCAKCRLNKYCSPACQKKVWPRHKKVCVRHFKRPVYDIVSYDPSDSDYFKTIGASPNRPNIAIIVKTFPDPIAAISDHLIHMSAEHNYRVGYFGAARFPKTGIMLPDGQSCERMLKLIREFFVKNHMWTRGEVKEWLCGVTPGIIGESKRMKVLEEWPQVDSTVRILVVSPPDHLDVNVPDVGTVIVVSREGPAEMGPRWQRMARMSGQLGTYVQFVPLDDHADDDDDDDDDDNNIDEGGDEGGWQGKVCRRTQALKSVWSLSGLPAHVS